MLKLTTDKHEASHSLSATAELLVFCVLVHTHRPLVDKLATVCIYHTIPYHTIWDAMA